MVSLNAAAKVLISRRSVAQNWQTVPGSYGVANWANAANREVVSENVATVNRDYYEGKGYTILDVQETGDKYRPFRVLMMAPPLPVIVGFPNIYQAKAYVKENLDWLWEAYTNHAA